MNLFLKNALSLLLRGSECRLLQSQAILSLHRVTENSLRLTASKYFEYLKKI